jgi:general nucleoside transport system permease protein
MDPSTDVTGIGFWGVPLAVASGAVRIGTPFLFVSLGECLTEKSGRVNLGLEGTLVMGAMGAYAISYYSGSAWLGVLVAGFIGAALGALHGWLCGLPRVNDIAIGIALISFGTGLAFFLGKPFIQPSAPKLPAIDLGFWSHSPEVRSALQINALFVLGLVLAPAIWFMLKRTRWGLILRTVGESSDAARAMGYRANTVRAIATTCGGFLAGIGGSFLSLFHPGSWNERLSSGQGLMAVALVIFAQWSPLRCLWAALLFGASSALGPALQSVGFSSGYQLFNAGPYVLTLGIMIATSSAHRRLAGQPAELSVAR